MKNYQCKNCGTVVQSNSTPSNSGCPKKATHTWYNLGDVGTYNYQCKNCGTLIKANSTPSNSACPNSSTHTWYKL